MMTLDEIADLDRSRYTRLFSLLQPHLKEKTKRLVGAAMADSVGRGSQRMVQEISGVSSHPLETRSRPVDWCGIRIERSHPTDQGWPPVDHGDVSGYGNGTAGARKRKHSRRPRIAVMADKQKPRPSRRRPYRSRDVGESSDGLAMTRCLSRFHTSEPQAVRTGM